MKWVKLTLGEAAAIVDVLKCDDLDALEEAEEILVAAIENAVDEEIPSEQDCFIPD